MKSLLLGLVTLSQSLSAPPSPAQAPAPETVASPWPKIGATVHVDGNALREDQSAPFGSGIAGGDDGVYFRRLHVTFSGQLMGVRYRIEPQFAPMTDGGDFGFEDAYIALPVPMGELQFGQRRPFRSMEGLTNSNDILIIERPFAGSAGVYGGRQDREFGVGLFYKGAYDVITWGAGAYNLRALNSQGEDGLGVSARLTYAPILSLGQVVHLGVSASHDDLGGGATPANNLSSTVAYAGWRGPRTVVGSASGGEPASTIGLEVADASGPFFAQAEFTLQSLEQTGVASEQTVLAGYVQGSWFITGETKPYDRRNGVFGTPAPRRASGAWELTARYDYAVNEDAESFGGCDGGVFPDGCEVTAISLGVNYYLNPSVRFMLNYIQGQQDRDAAGKDKPEAIAGRLQLNF